MQPSNSQAIRSPAPFVTRTARSAAKRRYIHSLGRQPQEHGAGKNSKPRSGDRSPEDDGCGSRRSHNLSPLRGLILFGSPTWGSRPRLWICRAFGARPTHTSAFLGLPANVSGPNVKRSTSTTSSALSRSARQPSRSPRDRWSAAARRESRWHGSPCTGAPPPGAPRKTASHRPRPR